MAVSLLKVTPALPWGLCPYIPASLTKSLFIVSPGMTTPTCISLSLWEVFPTDFNRNPWCPDRQSSPKNIWNTIPVSSFSHQSVTQWLYAFDSTSKSETEDLRTTWWPLYTELYLKLIMQSRKKKKKTCPQPLRFSGFFMSHSSLYPSLKEWDLTLSLCSLNNGFCSLHKTKSFRALKSQHLDKPGTGITSNNKYLKTQEMPSKE